MSNKFLIDKTSEYGRRFFTNDHEKFYSTVFQNSQSLCRDIFIKRSCQYYMNKYRLDVMVYGHYISLFLSVLLV